MKDETAIILVVDDNPTNLGVLSDFFKNTPYEISSATSGRMALEVIELEPPDLVLLDIIMPEMDGFEVCQRLQESGKLDDIPVIFMTALSDTIDKVRGFNLGAVDYITKPFDCDEVLARVKTHLTIQRLKKELKSKNNQLQSKNEQLQDALKREKKLLARERQMMEDLRLSLSLSLPHELRTPLSAIIGSAELLIEKKICDYPEQVTKLGHAVSRNGQRLQRLIENYLLYARLKLLKYTSRERHAWKTHVTVQTEGLINELALQKAQEQNRAGDLVLDLINAKLQISPESFSKIVAEVIDNAFKFSRLGTAVKVTTRRIEDQFKMMVENAGRGMTEGQIENIGAYMQFERDIQEQQGSGLGLVISQLLTQLEGGELHIESKPEHKTKVTLIFRLNEILNEDSPND